jgi:choline dehydrogenase-like flavoprotein
VSTYCDESEIVVVGAGPAGLMLACEARAAGAAVLVLERTERQEPAPGTVTLDPPAVAALERRGLHDDLAAAALERRGLRDDPAAAAPGRWPRVERRHLVGVLRRHADRLGVRVHRGHEVVGVRQSEGDVIVTARTAFGDRRMRAVFLAGCDGRAGAVRALADVGPAECRADRVLLAGGAARDSAARDGAARGSAARDSATRGSATRDGAASPAAGLVDAVNLGWKLAAQVRGWAPRSLLDTYAAERHPSGPDRAAGDHPMVGRLCTDVPPGDLSRDGRGVLLDLAGDPDVRETARRWTDRVRVVAARARRDDVRAVLVRPDGYVAWVLPAGADLEVRSLQRALATWFGRAAA